MRIHSVAEQERTDRRRAQILAAASRVFARHGFHRATVRQVAQEAGIADGTVYLYFRSKRELLLALLGQLGLDALGDPVVDGRWDDLPGFLAGLWFDGLRPEGR